MAVVRRRSAVVRRRIVFFSVMAIYLGSLIVRYRNLKQNLELLEGLDS